MVRCKLCKHVITQARSMEEHCVSKNHIETRILRDEKKERHFIKSRWISLTPVKSVIYYYHAFETIYRKIIAAGKANTPISETIELGTSCVKDYSGCTLDKASDFTNQIIKLVLDSLNERISSVISWKRYFNEYIVSFDGTPSFAEAEAIVVCCVTKKWEVIEILVKYSLFEKKWMALS